MIEKPIHIIIKGMFIPKSKVHDGLCGGRYNVVKTDRMKCTVKDQLVFKDRFVKVNEIPIKRHLTKGYLSML